MHVRSAKLGRRVHRQRRHTIPLVERLEDRSLLATATLVGSHLQVNFTSTGTTAEQVTVSSNGTTISLSGNIAAASFGASLINQITVNDVGGGSSQILDVTGGKDIVLGGGFTSSGVERVTVLHTGTRMISTGSGAISVSAELITVTTGTSLITEDGGISLVANPLGTATSFAGVNIFALVETRGSGAINILGKGSPANSGSNMMGVLIDQSGIVRSISPTNMPTQGTITIQGHGNGIGRAGVSIGLTFGGIVLSQAGNITLVGQGGSGGIQNHGVAISNGANVSGLNGAAISITGTGGNGGSTIGVDVSGGATVQTQAGNVNITGTGGTAQVPTQTFNPGIFLSNVGILSTSGTISLVGNGGTSASSNEGIRAGETNIRSTNGPVTLTGAGGSTSQAIVYSSNNFNRFLTSGVSITLTADSIGLPNFAGPYVFAPLVAIAPRTPGTRIDIGGGDLLNASPLVLGLANFELDDISATTLRIGDAASGTITTVAPNTPPQVSNVAWNVELVTGGDIVFNAPFTTMGPFSTGSPTRGNLLLSPGPAGSVQPKTSATDVTTQTNLGGPFATSFAPSSDLRIAINGLTPHTQYDRLTALGAVNLTGADLALTGGFVSSPGNVFTIVSATSVTGIFNGLPENSEVVFNGRVLRVNYTAATVTLTDVRAANQAPDAADDLAATNEDTPVLISVLANDSDADGDPLSVTAVIDPPNGSVVLHPDGTVTYTPDANFHGTDTFSYSIADGQGGSDTAIVTVTINSVNDVPIAAHDLAATSEDTPVTIGVLANDSDLDGGTLSVVAASDPPHGTVAINPNGTIAYSPDANFYGTDSFTYSISDGQGGLTTATVTVAVSSVNDAPTAAADVAATNEDAPITIGVLANDSDVDGNLLSVIAVTDSPNGSIVLNPDGTVTYTPDANFHGTDAFSYTVSDGQGGNATATVTLTVRSLPDVDFRGRVFDDRNNDASFGAGDVGLAGVAVQLFSEASLAVPLATAVTAADGTYAFNLGLGEGVYRVIAAQSAGLLDGSETAGALGGVVDNATDSNSIGGIVITSGTGDQVADGYNFAELRPSRVQGLVWQDANNDGDVDFGEQGIDGVAIRLTGRDDRGAAVDLLMQTDGQGLFEFLDLRPSNAAGYTLAETQPQGFIDGPEIPGTVNGVDSGVSVANDVIAQIATAQPGSDAINYNFAELPAVSGGLQAGQTAGIGFWQNKNGQALIKSLNGGPSAVQLGNWLAASFPNMYGANAGPNNLAGMTNAEVAVFYQTLFKRNAKTAAGSGPPKVDAQILAVALAVYVTNENLAGNVAANYGFAVDAFGTGAATFNVGTAGAAFGLADGSEVRILDLLVAVNNRTTNGLLYDTNGDGDTLDPGEDGHRTLANDVFSEINEMGGI